ncbi:MAG: ATP-dependent DNA helicase RecG [Chitinophagales bacterium]|nr:ATP-dependent DNA helicase RecG [Chitinophagales bacterium]
MSSPSILETPIEYLKGVGPQKADLLKKELKIFTFGDLLFHYPFRYVDRSKVYKIKEIDGDMPFVQVLGTIKNLRQAGHGRSKRLIATLTDDSGSVELVWFKGVQFLTRSVKAGLQYLVFGKPNEYRGSYNIPHPEMTVVTGSLNESATGLQAVYPSSEKLKKRGLDTKGLLKLMNALFDKVRKSDLPEILPIDVLDRYQFPDRFTALVNVHLPKENLLLKKSIARLKFEEFFLIQLEVLMLKQNKYSKSQGFVFKEVGALFNTFYHDHLSFELTSAQKKVLKEIRRDTLSAKQMNRLLQGDVGSGKTIVSFMLMILAIDNGFQACIMAPTEILAQQHYETISEYCQKLGVKAQLLTGSIKGADRKTIFKGLKTGYINIIVGTHALLEDKVVFENLGVAIIDEQHRFGVAQRARLWKKNHIPPHILVMTATPIPRTLAMTVYGDLDVSVIDELPPGRKPIETKHWFDKNRLKLNGFLKEQIANGRQVYIVYPLIEESEKMDYKDLMDGYNSIQRAFPSPDYRISIVHGRMKSEDKEMEMKRFAEGQTQIMVATTVIEVGVNVPNASVMVIESAERFGLAQLHQLRGRVGRGADQSYCILMTSYKLSEDSRKRLGIMVETNDGFKIAEADLELRGPGDLKGTQQSGVLNLRIAHLIKDSRWLKEARSVASMILKKDPYLQKTENMGLRKHLEASRSDYIEWSEIS